MPRLRDRFGSLPQCGDRQRQSVWGGGWAFLGSPRLVDSCLGSAMAPITPSSSSFLKNIWNQGLSRSLPDILATGSQRFQTYRGTGRSGTVFFWVVFLCCLLLLDSTEPSYSSQMLGFVGKVYVLYFFCTKWTSKAETLP